MTDTTAPTPAKAKADETFEEGMARVRADKELNERIDRLMERDKELLDRLAGQ